MSKRYGLQNEIPILNYSFPLLLKVLKCKIDSNLFTVITNYILPHNIGQTATADSTREAREAKANKRCSYNKLPILRIQGATICCISQIIFMKKFFFEIRFKRYKSKIDMKMIILRSYGKFSENRNRMTHKR